MTAKLKAYLNEPGITLRQYPPSDQAFEARYARAIAYHRMAKIPEALASVDDLLASHPNDPYLLELKAQMLFENGRPKEALPLYRRAVELLPEAPLLRVDLARVQLSLDDPAYLNDAINNLRLSLSREPNRPFAWRQLAVALGRKGEMGESALALAEEEMLLGKKDKAKFNAGKAQRLLPTGSPGWIRAEDILRSIEQGEDE
jgi:predicted Zn-dependent protease